MILCLDIGNTHIYGGVFSSDELKLRFRYTAVHACTSDQFGLFLRSVLTENGVDPSQIENIALSSVVPSLDYSINAACIKYFSITPLELKPGVKTGIKLNVKNPLELGADRIANGIAATHYFPNKNIIIVDFGTATTLCAVSKESAYLGGVIMPGLKLSMSSLCDNTAKLTTVDIIKPRYALGRSTAENIQSGLYYGQLGAVKEAIRHIRNDVFQQSEPVVIATGGYAHLFERENIFSVRQPDLVLHGLRLLLTKNAQAPKQKMVEAA